jgi:Protein of unknown function (DUF2442)
MPKAANSKSDRSSPVAPTVAASSPWRVVSVQAHAGQRLRVAFADGTTGEVELGAFLGSASVVGSVFEALRDPATFAAAEVVMGAVTWPNGADLAPDAMYDAIRADGRWVPVAP